MGSLYTSESVVKIYTDAAYIRTSANKLKIIIIMDKIMEFFVFYPIYLKIFLLATFASITRAVHKK